MQRIIFTVLPIFNGVKPFSLMRFASYVGKVLLFHACKLKCLNCVKKFVSVRPGFIVMTFENFKLTKFFINLTRNRP